MRNVRFNGTPGPTAPKATNYADIKDQGRIPYGSTTTLKVSDPSKVKITRGTSRGMGAMLRGGKFTIS